ncbi:DUF1574 family protein [Cytophagaceae bacterium ABcell3]|nr:DUF1574 family protein [Cytophagaceae bacterium ABcell3]
MRKFVFNLLKTLAYLGLSYVMFVCALVFTGDGYLQNIVDARGGVGHSLVRFSEAENVSDVDVCFIGSSHAYRGFDTRFFDKEGLSAVNLGSPIQTPFNTYFVLNEYLEKVNPKVVVIETYWNMLVNDGTESAIDLISNIGFTSNMLEMAWEKKRDIRFLNSAFLGWLKYSFFDVAQKDIPHDIYISGGFVMSDTIANLPGFERKILSSKWDVHPVQMEYLGKILDLCQSKNIRVMLVSAPVTRELYHSVQKDYEAKYYNPIHDLAVRYGIPFWDYNYSEDVKLDALTHFFDTNHLTQAGVELFNQHFISRFKREVYEVDLMAETVEEEVNIL